MRRIFSIIMTVLLVLQPVGVPLAAGDDPCPMKMDMSEQTSMHHDAGDCCCDHACDGDVCGLECLTGTQVPFSLPPVLPTASVEPIGLLRSLADAAIPIGFDRPAFRPPIPA